MKNESLMRLIQELVLTAEKEEMWGAITIEFKDGIAKFVYKNDKLLVEEECKK
jgi:hypothetical protein